MKHLKSITAAALSVLMVGSCTVPVFAESAPSEKEEVIYIMTDASGQVTDTEAVNIFSGGSITDYGDYSAVKSLNTTDQIEQDGDQITFSTDADKVYYQGTMKDTAIPWNISIRYYLDGTEYSAADIAGKSGALEIHFSISKNESDKRNFYDTYALQAAFTLNTDQCKNIVADDATIANVGSNKQLSYTILPGKGIDTVIEADVTDFELSAVTINGVKLNMNLDIDDTELMDKVDEMISAIGDLDDGAGKLEDGTDEAQNGAETLTSGAKDLSNGADQLDAGMESLNSGIHQVQVGLDALNAKSGELTGGSAKVQATLVQLQAALNGVSDSAENLQQLTSASSQIKTGINQLAAGAAELEKNASYGSYQAAMAANGLDIDTLKSGNTQAIQSIDAAVAQADALEAKLNKMGIPTDGISAIKDQYEDLATQIETLLQGNNAAIDGTKAYLDALEGGASEVADGASALQKNYTAFDSAISELVNSLSDLMSQMVQLKDAINTLAAEYSTLDNGLNAYTDAVSSITDGYSQISDGAATMLDGTGSLASGSQTLYTGSESLLDGIDSLDDGASELKNGTSTMREKTANMDTQINEQIDSMTSALTGGDTETVSFVSSKNTNVDSVQFVIKTAAIEKAEAEAEDAPEEAPMTFWQKLTHLFGLN